MYERVGDLPMKKLICVKIFFIIMLFSSCKENAFFQLTDKNQELEKFDQVLFPYILSSYMWHSDFIQGFENITTDQVLGRTFEWIRFRSSIGKKIGEFNDFCLGVKNLGNDLNLLLLQIKPGHTCDNEENSILYSLNHIKRAIWSWPAVTSSPQKMKTMKLTFEWIEKGQWQSKEFSYDLPHYPINHSVLSWGKTWRNQKPYNDLESVLPTSILYLQDKNLQSQSIKMSLIPHTNYENWKDAKICFAVDDTCQPIIMEQCFLCEKGTFTLYNTKCKTHGTTFCGEIRCGQRGQPACFLGQHHIKQDDFKGCSPFTEEWFCHNGLEIKCTKEGAVCY
jgi:hypothetical protein